jgi:hypothetical protein
VEKVSLDIMTRAQPFKGKPKAKKAKETKGKVNFIKMSDKIIAGTLFLQTKSFRTC